MSVMTFVRRFSRPVAALGAALLVVSLLIGLATVDVGASRFGTLWVAGTGAAAVLLSLLAALRRVLIAVTWPTYLVAAWATAGATGPGTVGGIAQAIGWVVAAACVIMAIGGSIVHYDIAQNRPVSRL